jgi:hypothetical protein
MKRYIIPAIALLIGLTSCNWLDRTPKATLAPENYFRDETDLQLFSNSFYNNLLDKEPYEEQSDHYVHLNLSNVLRGGNNRTVPNSGGGWGSGSGAWGDLRKMNTLLEYIDKCEDKDAVVKYTALTRFFRAYFYFNMVKRFGDVPWIQDQLGTDSDELYAPRDSREVIMGHMIEDIDYAIENLPSAVSVYRVNRWTALALKARFCLFEGTFRKYHDPAQHAYMYVVPLPSGAHDSAYYLGLAADAAKEIIDNGPYKLSADYLKMFAGPDADKGEWILAIKNDQSLQICNNSTAFATMPTQGCPGLTRKFVASFLMADGSRFTDQEGWQTMQFVEEMTGRDPRLSYITVTPGYIRLGDTEVSAPDLGSSVTGYQLVKYVMDSTLPEVGRVDKSYNDMPVFRLAEVYLNYAEAKAELGTLTQEDLDASVNKLRDRVGMPHMDLEDANAHPDPFLLSEEYGYRNVTGANQGVILEIRRERGVELADEGFRLTDLIRWREGKCLEQTLVGMYFPGAGQYDLTGDGKPDLCLWSGTDPKHKDMVDKEIGTDTGVILSGGASGCLDHHQNVAHVFDENRDYYYPIPTKERQLNPNLKQNPGWNDGLSY